MTVYQGRTIQHLHVHSTILVVGTTTITFTGRNADSITTQGVDQIANSPGLSHNPDPLCHMSPLQPQCQVLARCSR